MSQHYVDPKTARQSYRPRNLMSPGLQRAREPFRLRNALTGVLLAGFAVGVWAYSIGAVKQDVFDDVDEEARALMAGSGIQKAEDGSVDSKSPAAETAASVPAIQSTIPATPVVPQARPETKSTTARGILPPLLERRFPSVLDPSSRTLVWGAPPVDNVGRLGDRASGSKRLV
ncbi:hypothetical protein GY45DRAFT_1301320 [Cubamyces sp. BRFM 1775]|nr:hypothetical protein GY45DRAFT_1301320 [Cubamyces sp. BRFM 1775]